MVTMGRAWRFVSIACEAACGLCLVVIAFSTLYEIVSRYVFDTPTLWAQDVAIYAMIWCTFLGLLPTDRAGQHIRIDVWCTRLPARTQAILERFTYATVAVFMVIAAWAGFEMMMQSIRFGRRSLSLFSVPMWIPQSALVCGSAIFAIECMRRVVFPGSPRGAEH